MLFTQMCTIYQGDKIDDHLFNLLYIVFKWCVSNSFNINVIKQNQVLNTNKLQQN